MDGRELTLTYCRVDRIVNAVAGKVVLSAAIGFVGCGLAFMNTRREPTAESVVVATLIVSL